MFFQGLELGGHWGWGTPGVLSLSLPLALALSPQPPLVSQRPLLLLRRNSSREGFRFRFLVV